MHAFFVDASGSNKLYETLVEKGCPPQRVGRSSFIVNTEIEALLVRIPLETGNKLAI